MSLHGRYGEVHLLGQLTVGATASDEAEDLNFSPRQSVRIRGATPQTRRSNVPGYRVLQELLCEFEMSRHPQPPVAVDRLAEHVAGLVAITRPIAVEEHLCEPAAHLGLCDAMGEL